MSAQVNLNLDHCCREANTLELEKAAQLSDKITLLAARINAATYQFLKLVAEFDACKGWSGTGIRSCAHWLNWKCGIAYGAAREKLRVARCLDNLPLISKAFEDGEISYSKVRAMTRVATEANEDFLLMTARYGTASHIEKLVRKYQRVEKNQQMNQQTQHYLARSVVYYQEDSGMWVLHAKLSQEEGALIVKAIDEVMRQQDKPLPDIGTDYSKNVSAETFLAEVTAGPVTAGPVTAGPVTAGPVTAGPVTAEPAIVETATFEQKRADALTAIAEHYVASVTNVSDVNGTTLKSLAGHERTQVVLHLNVETLKHAHCCEHNTMSSAVVDSATCQHHTPPHLDNQWISLDNAKRLSCDASLLTVLEDENGNVLNVSRKTRAIPSLLKRALDIRDETCCFPGCCESHYVDFHHIKHWAEGGETNKHNLVKLCRFHHRALHQGQYFIETKCEGNKQELIFKAPTGQVMDPNPRAPICNVENHFEHWVEQQFPDIDSRTGITRWTGETMDYGLAVSSMFDRRDRAANGEPIRRCMYE
jgi:hypothetical protein